MFLTCRKSIFRFSDIKVYKLRSKTSQLQGGPSLRHYLFCPYLFEFIISWGDLFFQSIEETLGSRMTPRFCKSSAIFISNWSKEAKSALFDTFFETKVALCQHFHKNKQTTMQGIPKNIFRQIYFSSNAVLLGPVFDEKAIAGIAACLFLWNFWQKATFCSKRRQKGHFLLLLTDWRWYLWNFYKRVVSFCCLDSPLSN